MQCVILAGGYGTRISEETSLKPKPMVEIGGKPILWHILKIYSSYGINDFIICCGYKGYAIKEYFANYFLHMSDVTIDLSQNKMSVHQQKAEPWKITLVDTGENTMTGGRLKRVSDFLDGNTFCLTYGDGVSDINLTDLIHFHNKHGKYATITAVQPPGRFGVLSLGPDSSVQSFKEKPQGNDSWINGGFFVLEANVIDYISGDATLWEKEPLQNLTDEGMLSAFRHTGFWQPMDTLRDKNHLESLWSSNQAPWKTW